MGPGHKTKFSSSFDAATFWKRRLTCTQVEHGLDALRQTVEDTGQEEEDDLEMLEFQIGLSRQSVNFRLVKINRFSLIIYLHSEILSCRLVEALEVLVGVELKVNSISILLPQFSNIISCIKAFESHQIPRQSWRYEI